MNDFFNPQPKKGVKLKKSDWDKLVQEAFKRDNYICQICNEYASRKPDPHHIIPRSRLRLDILENILTLCRGCHRKLTDGLLNTKIDDLIDEYDLRKFLK